jgi:tricorn protease-like protein
MPTGVIVAIVLAAAAVFVYVVARVGASAGQKRGYSGMGGDTIVRCSRGHLFTTKWIVGASVKAVRLGYKRYQRCPVCEKWRIVVPVRDDELSDEDRRVAAEHRDTKLP